MDILHFAVVTDSQLLQLKQIFYQSLSMFPGKITRRRRSAGIFSFSFRARSSTFVINAVEIKIDPGGVGFFALIFYGGHRSL